MSKELGEIRSKMGAGAQLQCEQERQIGQDMERLQSRNRNLIVELKQQREAGDGDKHRKQNQQLREAIAQMEAREVISSAQLADCEKEMAMMHEKAANEYGCTISDLRGELGATNHALFALQQELEDTKNVHLTQQQLKAHENKEKDMPRAKIATFSPVGGARSVSRTKRLMSPVTVKQQRDTDLNSLVLGPNLSGIHTMDAQQQRRQLARMTIWNEACEGERIQNEDSSTPDYRERQDSGIFSGECVVQVPTHQEEVRGDESSGVERAKADPWEQMLKRGPIREVESDGEDGHYSPPRICIAKSSSIVSAVSLGSSHIVRSSSAQFPIAEGAAAFPRTVDDATKLLQHENKIGAGPPHRGKNQRGRESHSNRVTSNRGNHRRSQHAKAKEGTLPKI
jgi:hypothetical protein